MRSRLSILSSLIMVLLLGLGALLVARSRAHALQVTEHVLSPLRWADLSHRVALSVAGSTELHLSPFTWLITVQSAPGISPVGGFCEPAQLEISFWGTIRHTSPPRLADWVTCIVGTR